MKLGKQEHQWLINMRESWDEPPRLSPSGWKTYFNCPGAPRLIQSLDLPDNSSTRPAAQGTLAHTLCEDTLQYLLDGSQFDESLGFDNLIATSESYLYDRIGETHTVDGFKFIVDSNMTNAVQVFVNYVIETCSDLFDYEVFCESFNDLDDLDLPGVSGGTCDLLIIDWDNFIIEVGDYKHGAGVPVEVFDNGQAWQYVLAIYYKLKKRIKNIDDFTFKCTIVQPRCTHEEGSIRTQYKTVQELLLWRDEVLTPKVIATYNPDAELVPTADGCMFCAAKPCEVMRKQFEETMLLDFDNLSDDFDDFHEFDIETPKVNTLTSAQKLAIYENIDILRQYLNAVTVSIGHEIMNGSKEYAHKIKMVKARTKRKFIEGVFEDLFNPVFDYIEDEELLFNKKPKGLGEIENVLKKSMREQNVKHYAKKAKEIIDEITTKPNGVVTIAPISDKRESLMETVTTDFSNLKLDYDECDNLND